MKVVLASGNAGKLRELGALLAPLHLELITQAGLGIEPAAETGCTFVENALIKARHASEQSGLPAIADDSGISVAALSGAPGVRSARFAGARASDADNNAKLLALLAGATDRRAHFCCVMVYLRHPEDPMPIIATGRWHGEIARTPRGGSGFGYDPCFFLPELSCTAAELPQDRKNRISHRGLASAALVSQLAAEFEPDT